MMLLIRKIKIDTLVCAVVRRIQSTRFTSSAIVHEGIAKRCKTGDKVTVTRVVTRRDVEDFARLSGDTNPIHLQGGGAGGGKMVVVHGALLNGLVSGVIGTQLPGAGTLVVWQSLFFPNSCYAGEEVAVGVEVSEVRKIIKLKFECSVAKCSQNGGRKCVLYGEARVVQR